MLLQKQKYVSINGRFGRVTGNTEIIPKMPEKSGFQEVALASDRRRQIAGWGVDNATGDIHTYLAIPYRYSDGTIPPVNFSAGVSRPAQLSRTYSQIPAAGLPQAGILRRSYVTFHMN